jgi:DNA mismatch repair protein MutS
VPGRAGRISPVDSIFTHFPLEERPDLNVGRLGEEAKRLCSIFQQVTRHSLVLLNESLSSTSPGESFYLSQDIVRGLCLYGVRAVFATHLHELAEKIDLINADMPGDSQAASIVAGAQSIPEAGSEDIVKLTYKIVPAPPMGTSYAKNIANRFGISFEQLAQMLQDRSVVPAIEDGGDISEQQVMSNEA